MKFAIALALSGIFIAPATAAPPTTYGKEPTIACLKCVGADLGAAFRGDFSNWVLPDWIGGKHLRPGEISACEGAGR